MDRWMPSPLGAKAYLPQVSLAGTPAGGARMGQKPFEWYQRAKAAVAKYDNLFARAQRVANKTASQEILASLGDRTVPGTAAYRYATVVSDVATDVEAYRPPNYNAYQLKRRQDRIVELEGFNRDFESMVVNAEQSYGILPAPEVIERERVVTREVQVPGAPAPGPDYTTPILVAGGAVALAFLLGVV